MYDVACIFDLGPALQFVTATRPPPPGHPAVATDAGLKNDSGPAVPKNHCWLSGKGEGER